MGRTLTIAALRALEILAWSAFFVFAVVFLALRYWVLPNVERYRDDIVAVIARSLELPVTIGAIEAGWQGLRPQLRLADVRIHDRDGREALRLPAVENVVSWRSLLFLDLRLRSLTIDGPKLSVRRDASGALTIAGMKLSQDRDDRRLTDWILGQNEIVIRNAEIEWRDELRKAPPLALEALNFRMRNDGDEHSIGLAARPPAALGASLELRVELAGRSITDPSAWSGELYAELGTTDLAGWRAWVDYPVDLRQGKGALRLWAVLEGGVLKRATADVALTGVAARLGKDLPVLELASLRGRVQGRTTVRGYEISAQNLALAGARGARMQATSFRLVWAPAAANAPEQGSLTANLIELEPLAQLGEFLPFPQQLRQLLADLAPRGNLLDAKFEWTGQLPQAARFAARTRFAGLAMHAWREIPGFTGLSGSVEATEAKGSVFLAAARAEIDLPKLFPEPRLQLDSLNGQLDWERRGEKGVQLRLSSLNFANEHLAGSAYGSYATAAEGPGTIDLTAQLARADGRQIAKYLPHGPVIGVAARAWLAGSILAGQASDARLRLKGELRDFPFADPAKGQFEVAARIAGGVIDYANHWPRINDIEAELLFERDKLEIVGRRATILGAALSGVRVSIPSLLATSVELRISGQADGPTAEFLKYVEQSPVRAMVDGFTEGMRADGAGRLRLKLELPLGELAKSRVAGEYQFANNSVTLHPRLPPVERAAGKLAFTDSGLTLHDVHGRLFGGEVALAGGTTPEHAAHIVATGRATVAGTRPLIDHGWRRHISGAADYKATVSLQGGRTQLSFESNLRGVASTLPAPLTKVAGDALPLRVDVLPSERGERDRVSVTLGRVAAAEFLRRRQGEDMQVQRTSVWLSPSPEQQVRLPERPGVLVYGALAALDLDQWLPLFEGEAGPGSQFDLKVGTLDVFGKRVRNVALRAGADEGGWSANVSADELAGDISYRRGANGRLIARLAHFRIPDDTPGAKPVEGAKDLPAVDLISERFSFRGKQLGRVEVAAQHAGADWRIEKIRMVNPEASLNGRGQWRTGAATRTSLEFELDASDAGKFLERVGYSDLVKGGKAKLGGSLAWNGDPVSVHYPSLAGELSLRAEDGQFLEIEPGIGKLVSLMSLQMLPRRIALDFRDVFSKGFQYDLISASLHIGEGVLRTEDFRMRGAAAVVEMKGQADLGRETQDLHVRVIPALGDTASTVVGLLNPVVGLATMIAQRVLKNPLGRIFAFEYAVTGSWSDPKVEKVSAPPAPPEEPKVPEAAN